MMNSQSIPPITTGKEEYAERFTNVISAAFANNTLNRAVILAKDSLPNNAKISDERRAKHFLPGVSRMARSGGILAEAGNFAVVALWFFVHARDVYAYFGFKVIEEIVIGGGSVAKDGNIVEGGEGIVIHGMLVEPASEDENATPLESD